MISMNSKAVKHILIFALAMSMILGNSSMLVCAAEADSSNTSGVTVVSTPEEYAEHVGVVEVGNTEQVTIDTATGEVTTESGEEKSFEEVFETTSDVTEALTDESGAENLEDIETFLDDKEVYDIRETGAEELEVNFPFAYKQLLLCLGQGELKDSYGAVSVVYNTMVDQYVLEYDTQEETREAYDRLRADYGEDKVIISLPVRILGYKQTKTNYTPSDSYSWGNDYMGLDALRDRFNREGKEDKVTVAVLDSGINKDAALFKGRAISEYSTAYIQATKGSYEYYDDIPVTNSLHSHGTHVAGIVADGTSDNVELMIIKVLGSTGTGALGNVFNAAVYAVDHGADVINMSLGINLYESDEAVYTVMDKYLAYAQDHGAVVIAAAGNDSLNMDESNTYPASSKYAYAVSSMRNTKTGPVFDDNYSNHGKVIAYAAPGTTIASAYVGSSSDYILMTGTSMAAPHVAAAYAMAKVMNPAATPAQLESFINGLTEDYGTPGRDPYYGNGPIIFNNEKLGLKDEELDDNDDTGIPGESEGTGDVDTPGNPDDGTISTEQPGDSGSDSGTTGEESGDSGAGDESGIKDGEQSGGDESEKEDDKTEEKPSSCKPVVKLSSKSFVYNGKEQKPSVKVYDASGNEISTDNYSVKYYAFSKNVGKYNLKVTLKNGMQGEAIESFTIVPKKTTAKIGTTGKTYITAKWTKLTTAMSTRKITGYQVQIAKNSKFTSGKKLYTVAGYSKSSKKITGLKRHTRYYVRVRTYMTVNGEKLYSSWSGYKSVKTK